MKVAIVAPEVFPVPPVRGGAVEAIIEELSARLPDHEVRILGIADPRLPRVEVTCPKRSHQQQAVRHAQPTTHNPQLATACICEERAGHRVYHRWQANVADRVLLSSWKLPWKRSGSIHSYRPYSRWAAAQLRRIRPDVVQVISRMAFVPWIRRALPTTPILLSLHQLSSLDASRLWSDSQVAACDLITGCSQFLVDEIRRRVPSTEGKVSLLRNGIDPARIRPWWEQLKLRERVRQQMGLQPQDLVMLFAGRLVEQKGVHVLAEAFNQLVKSEELRVKNETSTCRRVDVHTCEEQSTIHNPKSNIHNDEVYERANADLKAPHTPHPTPHNLLIVGSHTYSDSTETPYIQQLKQRLGPLGSRVVWAGYRPSEETASFYAASDMVIVPSITPETFSMVTLEAMATGIPVIAFAHGGPAELIRHEQTGWLVDPQTGPHGLAQAMERLCGDAALRQRLGREARGDVERHWGWGEVAEEFALLCERARASSRRRTVHRPQSIVHGSVGSRQPQPTTHNSQPATVLIAESGSGYGGSAKYLSELVHLLDRSRYDVRVLAAEDGPFIARIREQGVPVLVRPRWRFPFSAISNQQSAVSNQPASETHNSQPATRNLSLAWFRYTRYALLGVTQLMVTVPGIARWLRRERIRLVHLNNEILSHLPLALAARMARCRVVCHLHGWRPLTKTERWAAPWVDEFICISEAGARFYREQLPGRGVVAIPNGILLNGHRRQGQGTVGRRREAGDSRQEAGGRRQEVPVGSKQKAVGSEQSTIQNPKSKISREEGHECADVQTFKREAVRSHLGVSEDDVVVAIVGRLVPWKGHEIYLKALAALRSDIPSVVGLIVGNDPRDDQAYLQQLKRLAQAEGFASRVRFLPWQQEMDAIYAACDILVHASVRPEPFGLVILEAMAAGKPVVATAAGGVLDVVKDGDTGLLVEPGDADALTRALRRLIEDRALATTLAQRGRQRVYDAFTMERNAAHVSAVYDSLLGGHSEDRAGKLS